MHALSRTCHGTDVSAIDNVTVHVLCVCQPCAIDRYGERAVCRETETAEGHMGVGRCVLLCSDVFPFDMQEGPGPIACHG